jgi:ABC-type lipoprotein export system ATPase subunit
VRCATSTCAIGRGRVRRDHGPSGSGKSTLMNCSVASITRAPARTLRWRGCRLADAEGRAQLRLEKIGFVFQGFNLLPRMNALENVAMPMATRT